MDHDTNMHFQFAHLSSKTGLKYFQDLNIPTEVDSLILIQGNKYFTESTAALKISKHLNKGWPLMYGLIIVPKFVRNFMRSEERRVGKECRYECWWYTS